MLFRSHRPRPSWQTAVPNSPRHGTHPGTTYSFYWPARQDTCHIHISGGEDLRARHACRSRAFRRADSSACAPLRALLSPDVQRSRVAAERPAIGEPRPVSRCVAPCECKSFALALTLRRPPPARYTALARPEVGRKGGAMRSEASAPCRHAAVVWSIRVAAMSDCSDRVQCNCKCTCKWRSRRTGTRDSVLRAKNHNQEPRTENQGPFPIGPLVTGRLSPLATHHPPTLAGLELSRLKARSSSRITLRGFGGCNAWWP